MRSLTVAAAAALVLLTAAPAWAAGQPPMAVDDAVNVPASASGLNLVDALGNDSDPEGDPLTYTAVTAATKGLASIQSGKLFYQPYLGNTGLDSFTYTVSDGQSTATATVTVTIWSGLPAPTGLGITAANDTSATLSWSAAQDAVRYQLFRNGVLVQTTSSTTWTDTGLSPDQQYDYRIASVNAGGFGGQQSGPVYRQRRLAPPLALTVDLTADPTALSLIWSPGGGPWNIYRDGVLVANPSSSVFTDTGLVTGRAYSYQIQTAEHAYPTELYPASALTAAVQGTPGPLSDIGAFYIYLRDSGRYIGTVTVPERAVPGGRQQDHSGGIIVQKDGQAPVTVRTSNATAYTAAGGAAGQLGFPLAEQECGLRGYPYGCAQPFEGGGIWYQQSVGTHVVLQEMEDVWADLDGEEGRLGYPADDEYCGLRADGCFQEFQGGSIYSSPATGIHSVFLPYEDVWSRYDWEDGRLGYPTTDETCAPGKGCYQQFQGGTIYWSPTSGMHAVFTPYLNAWAAQGAESGRMGYPVTGEICAPGKGCYQQFQGGTIYWSPTTGMHAVFTPYLDAWGRWGRENGRMGYPVTDEVCGLRGGGCTQHFQAGSVYWSPASGIHPIVGGIRDVWGSQGWQNGRLGYPVSSEWYSAGVYRQDFQGGTITIGARGAQITYR